MGARLDVSAARGIRRGQRRQPGRALPPAPGHRRRLPDRPGLQGRRVRKERKTRLDGLKSVKDNPGAAVRYYFQKAYFGDPSAGPSAPRAPKTSLAKMTAGRRQGLLQDLSTARPRPSPPSSATSTRPRLIELLNAHVRPMDRPRPSVPAVAAPAPAQAARASSSSSSTSPTPPRPTGSSAPPATPWATRSPRGRGHEHALRRPLHLLAHHRAADQARPDLRRRQQLPDLRPGGTVHRQLLHQERQDRRDARHRLRPARRRPGPRASRPRRSRAPATTSWASSRRPSRPTPARPGPTSGWPSTSSASTTTTSTWTASGKTDRGRRQGRRGQAPARGRTSSWSSSARRPRSRPSSPSSGPGRRRRSPTRDSEHRSAARGAPAPPRLSSCFPSGIRRSRQVLARLQTPNGGSPRTVSIRRRREGPS